MTLYGAKNKFNRFKYYFNIIHTRLDVVEHFEEVLVYDLKNKLIARFKIK